MSDFSYPSDKAGVGHVTLGASYPSKIIPLHLQDSNGTLVCSKNSLLCAGTDINIEMAFSQKLTTGIFGGEGFVLQKLTGDDYVLLKVNGRINLSVCPIECIYICMYGHTQI